jgi:protein gp37
MADTSIEWTHRDGTKGVTWNPTTGCDKISDGCTNCYALTMAGRLKAMGSAKYRNDGDPRTSGPGFGVTVHEDTLDEPFRWRTPRTVFVNSMSDLFHARVPSDFVARVWSTMAATPRHTYQILTKRPERMARWVNRCALWDGYITHNGEPPYSYGGSGMIVGYPEMQSKHYRTEGSGWPIRNAWLGTSIESDERTGRADHLRATPAAVRFISAEPLLGPLPSLDLTGIDWLIIGGESGPGSRPMDLRWVYGLIDLARTAGTAVFVKQLGKIWAGGGKGGDWSRWPADLRIREYPQLLDNPLTVTS